MKKKDMTGNDIELALHACKKSLELSPNNPYSLNLLAEIYLKKTDLINAKSANEEAAKYAKKNGGQGIDPQD